MDRRKFIELMTSGIAAANASSMLALGQNQSTRPNFLFIIADDLMYRTVHGLNNPEVHTPNLDRLAASGCAFTHCFHQGSWSGAVCVPMTCIVQTICVTGSGESFSNCNSTIENVSSRLLAGSSTTRRKTLSAGNHATFNFGCHSEAQVLATNFGGNGSPCGTRCSRPSTKPLPFASNCQSRLASGAICRMLQVFQRDI